MKNQLLSIEDHYKELRHRVMSSLESFVLLLIVAIVYSEDCLALVLQLGKDCGYSFVSLSPQEVLLQQLRVALVFFSVGYNAYSFMEYMQICFTGIRGRTLI